MFSTNLFKKILYSSVAVGLLSGCALFEKKDSDKESNWIMSQFEKDGNRQASEATVAYSQGDFNRAEEFVLASLKDDPRNQQALLVGALTYEKLGRPNRARQFYEDLIVINGKETSILGTNGGVPEKISEIANKRLRLINVKQSELVVETKDGTKVFSVPESTALRQSKSAIAEALFAREKKMAAQNQPSSEEEIRAVEVLFSDPEQNVISRFLILKELAEKDLITKEEFLTRRQTNIGGLLPLSNTPPAAGIDNSVPSPDLIIERINVLKDATESRAITPREYLAERNLIIEALLPPNPRTRMKPKAPAKDILGAAKDLRKLEILYDLNLITSKEKEKEQKAIEKHLGINRAPAVAPTPIAPAATAVDSSSFEKDMSKEVEVKTVVQEEIITEVAEPSIVVDAPVADAPKSIVPEVSSPFINKK